MDLHQNARNCPLSRAALVERVTKQGWTVREACQKKATRASATATTLGTFSR